MKKEKSQVTKRQVQNKVLDETAEESSESEEIKKEEKMID